MSEGEGEIHGNDEWRRRRVVAVIPAHDEQEQIAETLRSLLQQSVRPDRILVVADNCTDDTAGVAAACGEVEVLETAGNRSRKAGALNQAWAAIEGTLDDDDLLLALDADTLLTPRFVEHAQKQLERRPELGAVCGSFVARPLGSSPWARFLALLQRIEYERYRRQLARKKGATRVLSGGVSLFRVSALRAIADERGFLYDESSIVEDFELTLAMRARGMQYAAPKVCTASTESMPTLSKLWHQRVRWYRGTLDELRKYGMSRLTVRDYLAQALLFGGVLLRVLFVAAITLTLLSAGSLQPSPFWLALAAVTGLERALSVRALGVTAMLVAALLVVEGVYTIFAESYFVRSLWLHLRSREVVWHAT
jgi:cellulose synthase/poly-beta-1,6-N-acetylglucosamine synthase-like glycosyltransferase